MRMIVIIKKREDSEKVYAINIDAIKCIDYISNADGIYINTGDSIFDIKIDSNNTVDPIFIRESDIVMGEVQESARKSIYDLFELYNEILDFYQYSDKLRLTIETRFGEEWTNYEEIEQ